MNGLLIKILQQLQAANNRAYWQDHHDCGGDFHPLTCPPCNHHDQCLGNVSTTTLINQLETDERR